jgi:hypothetical protein
MMRTLGVHQIPEVDMPKLNPTNNRVPKPLAPTRLGYTVTEFITDVVPMSKAHFYNEVKAGRINTLSMGRRRIVPASEGPRYLASLAAE